MKLLVPVDFSDITNPVLRTVKNIAQKHEASVCILHVVSPVLYIPYPESLSVEVIDVQMLKEIEETKKKEAEEKIKALKDFLEGIEVKTRVEVGDPREVILEIEEKERPDLIVIGSHRKGLIERLLVGSTAEKIVKHSKHSVLIIKGKEPEFKKSAVIGYDFSKTAERMLEFAINFLKPFEVNIKLLHVDEPIDIPVIEKIGEKIYKKYREEKKKYLEKLKERLEGEGFKVETYFIEGKEASEGICDFIEENEDSIDLLIMGSKGLSGIKRLILGSTSTEVFRKVEVPILIYKTEET